MADNFLRNLIVYFGLVSLGGVVIYQVFQAAPALPEGVCDNVSLARLPCSVLPGAARGMVCPAKYDDATVQSTIVATWKCTKDYVTVHRSHAFIMFISIYATMKSLGIPGVMILSILSGALYSLPEAQLLVVACEIIGCCNCYLLSSFIGGPLAARVMPDKIAMFQSRIDANKDGLFWYVLFVRLTPIIPNGLNNIASPLVGVPFWMFAVTCLIGVQPSTYLSASMGKTLQTLGEDKFDLSKGKFGFFVMMALQFVALLPVIFKKRIAEYDSKRALAKKAN